MQGCPAGLKRRRHGCASVLTALPTLTDELTPTRYATTSICLAAQHTELQKRRPGTCPCVHPLLAILLRTNNTYLMKTLPTLTSSLALSALLLTAHAQGLPKVTTKAVNTKDKAATARKTADQRAAAYKGPKVEKSTKALGNKMLRESKPATNAVPVPPVKQ